MRVSQRARLIDAGITTVHELAGHTGPVAELSARTVDGADRAGAAADRPESRRQAALRGRRRAAADGAARREQGRSVLRLRGRPAVDRRRPRVGTGIPVGCPDARRTNSTRSGRTTAPVNARRWSTSWPWSASGCKRYPGMHIYHYAAYEKSTLLRLAGRYGVGENDVDDLLRNGILVDLYPLVRKSIRVGTENYSIKSLEPLYMGNELRSGEVTTADRLDHAVRALLRAARRGTGRRSGGRAQGDRGLQRLRLPVDAPPARLDDGARHRIRRSAARPAAGARRRRDRTRRRPRTQTAQVRGRRRRTADRRADGRGDGRCRQGFSPARGQAVLVEPLRPRQQSRRRMGRQQRRLHRRRRPRSSTTGTNRPRRASRSGTCD